MSRILRALKMVALAGSLLAGLFSGPVFAKIFLQSGDWKLESGVILVQARPAFELSGICVASTHSGDAVFKIGFSDALAGIELSSPKWNFTPASGRIYFEAGTLVIKMDGAEFSKGKILVKPERETLRYLQLLAKQPGPVMVLIGPERREIARFSVKGLQETLAKGPKCKAGTPTLSKK